MAHNLGNGPQNSTGVNRTHRLADQLRSAIGWMGRVPSESQFITRGTLTPAEFVEAGDRLSTQYPTWQWQSCTNNKYQVFWLPPNKQFLLTKNVPCRHRISEWDKNILHNSHTTAEGWFVPEGDNNSSKTKSGRRRKSKASDSDPNPVAQDKKTEDKATGCLSVQNNNQTLRPSETPPKENGGPEPSTIDNFDLQRNGEVMVSHTVLSSSDDESDDSEDESEEHQNTGSSDNERNQETGKDEQKKIERRFDNEELDEDDFVDVANPCNDMDQQFDESDFTVLDAGPHPAKNKLASSTTASVGVFSSWRQSASNVTSQRLKNALPGIGFNAFKDNQQTVAKEKTEVRTDQKKGKSKVIPTRSYDISITYDKYYQSPRLWLFGYDENGIPLSSEAVFQDILPNYISKTVTVDPHPCTGVPTVSIHPCQHSSVLKNVVQNWILQGIEPRHDLSLFVLLKMIGSAVPTINYDFTMDVEMSFVPSARNSDAHTTEDKEERFSRRRQSYPKVDNQLE